MDEIVVTSRVMLREEVICKFDKQFQKMIGGRVGIIERMELYHFSPGYRYLVRWLRRGGRGKEFTLYHGLCDLRLEQQSEATPAATGIASITKNFNGEIYE